MSDDKQKNSTEATKDNLKPAGELTDKDLEKAAGGALVLDGIKGESTEDTHKDWVELL